ncbi:MULTISPECIES: hypothetical protein [Pseudomonas]|uniref:hypothetical protein n=1 Tax=Pseudomonas TaxID=286 RepID=UPI0023603108|nr:MULTISPECIES: hypothetical protein [Pseudomonas]WJV25888.1 hypothetical protein PSR66_07630 [Pseudomonas chlororaphis]
MAERTIVTGLEEKYFQRLELEAAKRGMTPEEFLPVFVEEIIAEKTRPKGAGKLRYFKRD